MYGLFNIAPNATPEQIRRNRAIIEQMMPRGTARYAGEGMVDLLSGIVAGIAGRRMGRAEDANISREQKMEALGEDQDIMQAIVQRANMRAPQATMPEDVPQGSRVQPEPKAMRNRQPVGATAPQMPQDPAAPVMGLDFAPYSQLGGQSGRVGSPWATGGYDIYGDDPYGARRHVGTPQPTGEMPLSPGTIPDVGPQAPGAFGGYDDGLRAQPYTADVPQMGGVRSERQPVDGKADRTRNQQEAFSLPGFNTTEGQVLGYTMRAAEANRVLNQMETQGTRWGQRAMEILPGNTENMLRDDAFQEYLNAEQNFLAAVLRRDTGAAITREEFELYRPMFFPQPGDGPGVIEQKRRMRESALAAMAAGTAEGFALLPEDVRRLVQPGGVSPASAQPAAQPEPTHRFNPATGQIEAIR